MIGRLFGSRGMLALAAAALGLLAGPADAQPDEVSPWENLQFFLANGKWLEGARIVGGNPALPGEDPWQVALIANGDPARTPFCGGSLVAPNVVLTAAHCFNNVGQAQQIAIVSGGVDLSSAPAPVVAREIVINPNYDPERKDADIALLFLGQDAQGTKIAVATPADEAAFAVPYRHRGRVTGWGRLQEQGPQPRQLYAVGVTLISFADCNDRAAHQGRLTANMLCAGGQYADACQWDSGGPLSVSTGQGRVLIGIVSWSPQGRCAQPDRFGVYARVANFEPWIRDCLAGGPCPRRRR